MKLPVLPLALAILAALLLAPASPEVPAVASDPVNAVLGDHSFVAAFGRTPTEGDSEDLRIRTHLAYVERLLRAADVRGLAPEARAERTRLLDGLAAYRERGAFPRAFPATATRRPCFIDAEGRICAVGHLIEASEGRAAAEAIAAAHRYARIDEMPAALLVGWAARSGFTLRELAMIQPTYGSVPTREPVLNRTVEQGALVTGALLSGLNAALIVQDRQQRWLGFAGVALGGGLLVLGAGDGAHHRAASVIVGGAALGSGLVQAAWPTPRPSGLHVAVGGVPDRARGGVLPGGTVRWRF